MVRELKCTEMMAGGVSSLINCAHRAGKEPRGFPGALRCSINLVTAGDRRCSTPFKLHLMTSFEVIAPDLINTDTNSRLKDQNKRLIISALKPTLIWQIRNIHLVSSGTLTLVRGNKYFGFPLLFSPLQKLNKGISHNIHKYIVLVAHRKSTQPLLRGSTLYQC